MVELSRIKWLVALHSIIELKSSILLRPKFEADRAADMNYRTTVKNTAQAIFYIELMNTALRSKLVLTTISVHVKKTCIVNGSLR